MRRLVLLAALCWLALAAPADAWTLSWSNNSSGSVGNPTAHPFSVGTDNAVGADGTITAGDLIVGEVVVNAASDPGEISLAGFTRLFTSTYLGTQSRTAFFYRVADGSEGASFSADWANSATVASTGHGWGIADFTGGVAVVPVDASALHNASGFTTAMATTSVAGTSGDLFVGMWGEVGGKNAYTDDAGLTNVFNNNSGSSGRPYVSMGFKALGASGATGAFTANMAFSNNDWAAAAVAFSPGSGVGPTCGALALRGAGC